MTAPELAATVTRRTRPVPAAEIPEPTATILKELAMVPVSTATTQVGRRRSLRRCAVRRVLAPRIGRGTALLTLGALAMLALVVGASAAWAHASFVEATPSDRATLDVAPKQVTVRFSEPVTVPTGGLRVLDGDVNRVDDGLIDGDGSQAISVGLPDDLPDGGYVVTYRVVSTDSHPVAGVSTFTVGAAEAVDDAMVAEMYAGGGRFVGILGAALRGIGYLAVLLAAGAVFIRALIVRRTEERRLADRLSLRAALLGIVGTVLAVPVQAAATGGGPSAALRPVVLGEVLASSFGQGALVRIVWLLVLAAFVARGAATLPTVLAAGAALGSFLLDGHQRSVEPMWLLLGADVVHLGGAAVWLGGLVLLVLLVRSRGIDDDALGAARLVSRFSGVALVSFVVLSLAGTAMSWALVRTPRALVTTPYGWTLLAKVGLVGLVVLVALYNRQRLVPAIAARGVPAGGAAGGAVGADGRLGGDRREDATDADPQDAAAAAPTPGEVVIRRSRVAWKQLRTTLTIEVALLVAVVAATGALATIQPAAQAAGVTGAFQTVEALTDDLDVEVTVDPNQAGLNAIHIYVVDATGRPAGDVEDLSLDLTYVPEGIGPLRLDPFFAGTGHWTTNTDVLAFAGEWRIEVIVGLDRFTEARTEITVVVNR